jgi:uncharacterized protein YndB with AHSA1/START domain
VATIDFRVGGRYLACMRSPDGRDYWSTGTYREIVPLKRIVATDSFADERGNVVPASHYGMKGDWPGELLVTVTFVQYNGGTRLTLRHAGFPDPGNRDQAREGWNQSFDKLAESLKEEISPDTTRIVAEPGRQSMVVTRTFDAPRERVFRAYTDPKLIPRWWGPERLMTTVERMDARPGGTWRFVQRDAEGNVFAFHGVYHDVTPPERIIDTFEYEGMPGHVLLETAVFEKHGGRTRVVSTSVFQTVEDRDGMLRSGMEEGTRESAGRLTRLLAETGGRRKTG